MKHPFAFALPFLLSLSSLPAFGSDAGTLPTAIEQATSRHPSIRAAEADVEAARAREAQTQAFPNPALTLQANEMPVANPIGGNLMAGVSLPLSLGGSRAARAEISRLETAIAETHLQDQRQAIVVQVTIAYAQVVHRIERVRLAQAALAEARRLAKAAEARYRSGDVPRVEVFRAEVEGHRAQRDLVVAESQQALAMTRLGLLLGHHRADPLLVASLPVPALRKLPPVSVLQDRMWRSRPELRRAELVIQVERQQRAVARAAIWQGTEVSVAGGLSEGQPAVSTALTLPLPLYRNQAEIAEADARGRMAEARLAAQRLRLEIELEEAHQEAAIALTRFQLVTESDLPQARRFADNARRRFMAGEGSGLEAVEALRTLREVETEHLEALLLYREALARLEQTVGTDLPL